MYVAEVSYAEVGRKQAVPREMVSLRKWRLVQPAPRRTGTAQEP